jgi:hypothetical protein
MLATERRSSRLRGAGVAGCDAARKATLMLNENVALFVALAIWLLVVSAL